MTAAGIINPVTGRRYVKSWRIEEFLPFAVRTYRDLEEELGIEFFYRRNIIRSLFNSGEENDWWARAEQPEYQKYLVAEPDADKIRAKTAKIYGYGEVTNAYQTDLRRLLPAYREKLESDGKILSEKFAFADLQLTQNGVLYRRFTADKIIFCDGEAASRNPFWSYLPWNGAKGEVLLVRIPDADFIKMFKYRIFIVPLPEKDLYWVGSKYDWNYTDNQPSEEGKSYLRERLRDALTVPFEVVAHRAAVRPTVKDRRPYLGLHPQFSQVGIFNGLGTKGASLAPFFAKQMSDFLIENSEIDPAVDVRRCKFIQI